MHSLITSYLLQSKECSLPGIGNFRILGSGVSTDADQNRLLPPFEEIIFIPGSANADASLIDYIAKKKNIPHDKASEILKDFCSEWKHRIEAGEKLKLETIGSIEKNGDGQIIFEREKSFHFLHPVSIDKPYNKEEYSTDREQVLPGEEPGLLTTNEPGEDPVAATKKNIIAEQVIVERSYWGFWVLILLAAGLVMLFYYFKDHNFTGSSIGNQSQLPVDSATARYIIK